MGQNWSLGQGRRSKVRAGGAKLPKGHLRPWDKLKRGIISTRKLPTPPIPSNTPELGRFKIWFSSQQQKYDVVMKIVKLATFFFQYDTFTHLPTGFAPDHKRVPASGHIVCPRTWPQRRASRLATEKGLTPGYREGSRAWLQRRASRLTTEKSLVPDHRYLVSATENDLVPDHTEGPRAWPQRRLT